VIGLGAIVGWCAWAWAAAPQLELCEAVRQPSEDEASEPLALGRDGWLFRQSDIEPQYAVGDDLVAGLSRWSANLAARGTRLALVLLPPRAVLAAAKVDTADPLASGFDPARVAASYHAAVAALRGTGVIVPDLLAAAETGGLGTAYFFARDHHWRPRGAQDAMEALAREVSLAGLRFSPVPFANDDEGDRVLHGSLGKRVQASCGGRAPRAETFPRFRSVALAPVDSSALLADLPPAEVVLAGTSHSNKGNEDLLNAGGFLRTALGTDVLNVGVDAGGYGTGLLGWLESGHALDPAPRLLAWEIGGRVPASLGEFFRVLIPTSFGDCDQPVAAWTGELRAGLTPLFATGAVAGEHYVVLETDDRSVVNFSVRFELVGGMIDVVTVRRGTRAGNPGKHFVAGPLSPTPLSRVAITTPAGTSTSAAARLCAFPPDEAGVKRLRGG